MTAQWVIYQNPPELKPPGGTRPPFDACDGWTLGSSFNWAGFASAGLAGGAASTSCFTCSTNTLGSVVFMQNWNQKKKSMKKMCIKRFWAVLKVIPYIQVRWILLVVLWTRTVLLNLSLTENVRMSTAWWFQHTRWSSLSGHTNVDGCWSHCLPLFVD